MVAAFALNGAVIIDFAFTVAIDFGYFSPHHSYLPRRPLHQTLFLLNRSRLQQDRKVDFPTSHL